MTLEKQMSFTSAKSFKSNKSSVDEAKNEKPKEIKKVNSKLIQKREEQKAKSNQDVQKFFSTKDSPWNKKQTKQKPSPRGKFVSVKNKPSADATKEKDIAKID